MKRLAIFDLDGTLIDTIADLATATNHALTQFGYPTHTVDEYRFFVGNGINKLFERALPEGEKTEENILTIRRDFLAYYDIHNADKSRPYPGIPELLQALQAVCPFYQGDKHVMDVVFHVSAKASEDGQKPVTGVTLNARKHFLIARDIKVKFVGTVIGDFN